MQNLKNLAQNLSKEHAGDAYPNDVTPVEAIMITVNGVDSAVALPDVSGIAHASTVIPIPEQLQADLAQTSSGSPSFVKGKESYQAQIIAAAGNTFIPKTEKGAAGGVATLGSDSKLSSSQAPTQAQADMSEGDQSKPSFIKNKGAFETEILNQVVANFIPKEEKGTRQGVATLGDDVKVPIAELPAAVPNGLATLGADGKVVHSQLPPIATAQSDLTETDSDEPDFVIGKDVYQEKIITAASATLIAKTEKGAAGGVATLDASVKVPIAELYAGTAGGLATLGADGKVVPDQLPPIEGGEIPYYKLVDRDFEPFIGTEGTAPKENVIPLDAGTLLTVDGIMSDRWGTQARITAIVGDLVNYKTLTEGRVYTNPTSTIEAYSFTGENAGIELQAFFNKLRGKMLNVQIVIDFTLEHDFSTRTLSDVLGVTREFGASISINIIGKMQGLVCENIKVPLNIVSSNDPSNECFFVLYLDYCNEVSIEENVNVSNRVYIDKHSKVIIRNQDITLSEIIVDEFSQLLIEATNLKIGRFDGRSTASVFIAPTATFYNDIEPEWEGEHVRVDSRFEVRSDSFMRKKQLTSQDITCIGEDTEKTDGSVWTVPTAQPDLAPGGDSLILFSNPIYHFGEVTEVSFFARNAKPDFDAYFVVARVKLPRPRADLYYEAVEVINYVTAAPKPIVGNAWNTVTFDTPLTVEEGDYLGFGYTSTGTKIISYEKFTMVNGTDYRNIPGSRIITFNLHSGNTNNYGFYDGTPALYGTISVGMSLTEKLKIDITPEIESINSMSVLSPDETEKISDSGTWTGSEGTAQTLYQFGDVAATPAPEDGYIRSFSYQKTATPIDFSSEKIRVMTIRLPEGKEFKDIVVEDTVRIVSWTEINGWNEYHENGIITRKVNNLVIKKGDYFGVGLPTHTIATQACKMATFYYYNGSNSRGYMVIRLSDGYVVSVVKEVEIKIWYSYSIFDKPLQPILEDIKKSIPSDKPIISEDVLCKNGKTLNDNGRYTITGGTVEATYMRGFIARIPAQRDCTVTSFIYQRSNTSLDGSTEVLWAMAVHLEDGKSYEELSINNRVSIVSYVVVKGWNETLLPDMITIEIPPLEIKKGDYFALGCVTHDTTEIISRFQLYNYYNDIFNAGGKYFDISTGLVNYITTTTIRMSFYVNNYNNTLQNVIDNFAFELQVVGKIGDDVESDNSVWEDESPDKPPRVMGTHYILFPRPILYTCAVDKIKFKTKDATTEWAGYYMVASFILPSPREELVDHEIVEIFDGHVEASVKTIPASTLFELNLPVPVNCKKGCYIGLCPAITGGISFAGFRKVNGLSKADDKANKVILIGQEFNDVVVEPNGWELKTPLIYGMITKPTTLQQWLSGLPQPTLLSINDKFE